MYTKNTMEINSPCVVIVWRTKLWLWLCFPLPIITVLASFNNSKELSHVLNLVKFPLSPPLSCVSLSAKEKNSITISLNPPENILKTTIVSSVKIKKRRSNNKRKIRSIPIPALLIRPISINIASTRMMNFSIGQ